MGVVVSRLHPTFRRQTSGLSGVAWRYITSKAEFSGDPSFLVVPCPDFFYVSAGGRAADTTKQKMGFQFSCFCKTVHWFRRSLELYPTARFVGKMEDDSVLYDARVLAELAHWFRVERRGGSHRRPSIWYGHFDWAAHRDTTLKGMFCGVGDNNMLHRSPPCDRGRGTLAPFANGGLDIRSRALAEQTSACADVWEYVSRFDKENSSYLGSCDGLQGYFMARCLARAGETLGTALHLPWPKYHPPQREVGVRMHTSMVHPDKRCMHGPAAFRRNQSELATTCAVTVPGWAWNERRAMLPFPFRLEGSVRPHGSPAILWHAANITALRRYLKLHVKREDSRYCDELPCTEAFVPRRNRSRPLAQRPRPSLPRERPANRSRLGLPHHVRNRSRLARLTAATGRAAPPGGGGAPGLHLRRAGARARGSASTGVAGGVETPSLTRAAAATRR